jgi:hypothetical protein
MKSLKYSQKNINNIMQYSKYVDHNFITTDPSILKNQNINLKNPHFFFVPVDKNIECLMFILKTLLKIFFMQ